MPRNTRTPNRRMYTVSVDLPPGVDSSMMAQYIYDAVANWTGGMDPQHPLGCKDIEHVVTWKVSGIQHAIRPREVSK